MVRLNHVRAPGDYELSQACRVLVDAFGPRVFLVGSSLHRKDHVDVDVRCVLPDEAYRRLFPAGGGPNDPFWSLQASSLSTWLEAHSGLPIDFQFQEESAAAREYPDQPRQFLGVFLTPLRSPLVG